ncbi:hypothetical protein OJAV_G00057330 [Oryzias javanicus]|uniref:Zona pellucida sperm-binding protein 4 n=1 Tax=Oryzias javanicus TaxID=123683 RepID=A0A3S2UIX2_ORYJA|nr:hypothetical protein OJAV_G00057330 [Oryzias javanicus]
MARQWSITFFCALTLLCSFLATQVDAQKGPPQDPKVPYPPYYPQPKPQDPQHVSPPYYPGKPQYPQQPQKPQYPQQPQKPQYPQTPQYPQQPQTPQYPQQPQTPQYPQQPQNPKVYVKSCEVPSNVRVPCGVPDISPQACDAIDCCHDGRACYFGTGATVQCTKDGHFIVVVAKDVTLPHLDLETISLLGPGQECGAVDSNSAFAIYYFPVTQCGTLVTEEPGVIVYENRMTSSYEVGVGPLGAITRDSSFELLFQCRYHATSVETLVVEVLPVDSPLSIAELGPLNVYLQIANGVCQTKGCDEVAAAYTSFYTDADYPVTKVLREPVYVDVQILGRTDPNLVLTLGRCWATTTPNAFSLPQWDILIDGCPYEDDRYLSALVPIDASSGLPFPTHHRRFLFKMFTFVDPHSMEPLREKVYIHCSTAACVPGQGTSCEPSCSRRKGRDTDAVSIRTDERKVVVSSGEVLMVAEAAQPEL